MTTQGSPIPRIVEWMWKGENIQHLYVFIRAQSTPTPGEMAEANNLGYCDGKNCAKKGHIPRKFSILYNISETDMGIETELCPIPRNPRNCLHDGGFCPNRIAHDGIVPVYFGMKKDKVQSQIRIHRQSGCMPGSWEICGEKFHCQEPITTHSGIVPRNIRNVQNSLTQRCPLTYNCPIPHTVEILCSKKCVNVFG